MAAVSITHRTKLGHSVDAIAEFGNWETTKVWAVRYFTERRLGAIPEGN